MASGRRFQTTKHVNIVKAINVEQIDFLPVCSSGCGVAFFGKHLTTFHGAVVTCTARFCSVVVVVVVVVLFFVCLFSSFTCCSVSVYRNVGAMDHWSTC